MLNSGGLGKVTDKAEFFRTNLRRLLKERWLTQRQAADRIGVNYKWMRRLCHQGLQQIDKRTASALDQVAEFLGVEVADLWAPGFQLHREHPPNDVLIKWTGGKRRQAESIVQQLPAEIETYFEPFVGGGAVLWKLLASEVKVKRFCCSDICQPLIDIWNLVKGDPGSLGDEYRTLWLRLQKEGKDFYYRTREEFNRTRSAFQFFFLLRTCRRGLARFNTRGEFASCFHYGRDGIDPDVLSPLLDKWHTQIRQHDVQFTCCDYRTVTPGQGDFLYLDPPDKISNCEFYSGSVELQDLFSWLRSQPCNYMFSLNGFVDGQDRKVNVPGDLFDDSLQLDVETGAADRLIGLKSPTVTDTLYIKCRSRQIVEENSKAAPSPEQRSRTSLVHGDCRTELPGIASGSIDAVITDPPYPEIDREYGRLTEVQWHDLMHDVVKECRRILKPTGSALFILQPNYNHVGQMRLWLWEFLVWAAREWNLVQDVYTWTSDAMPLTGTSRKQGLLRNSVKTCVWLGSPDCFRNQDNVLLEPSRKTKGRMNSTNRIKPGKNRKGFREARMATASAERGGTTPFNMIRIANGGRSGSDHPASTSRQLADWWCRYLLPEGGVLLDPFAGSGTILWAGLDQGASRVTGIEKELEYCQGMERHLGDR